MIDAHVHLWYRALDPQDWIDPQTMAPIDRDFGAADLGAMLVASGLDRAVVVQASNSLAESVRLGQLDPSVVAGLVGWVDLTAEVGPQLDRIRRNATVPVVGMRHLAHIDPDPEWMLREDVALGLGALEAFGPDRLLYGSDWPLAELGGGAAAWKSAVDSLFTGLSEAERRRVFGDNAAEVYCLF